MRLFMIPLAALALASCGANTAGTVNSASGKTAIIANDLYRHASAAGEDLVKAGLLDKAAFQAADSKAYNILLGVRAGRATLTDLVAATSTLSGSNVK